MKITKISKIRIIVLLLIILITGSQNILSEEKKAFFWEMSDETGKKTYLMGSIHLGNEDMYPLPKVVMQSFERSDVLVLEINMNEANPMTLMQKAMYSDDRTLESTVSKEHFEFFESTFRKYSIPKSYYNKFKPWFAAMFASSMDIKGAGYSEHLGIDMYFLNLANEREMEIDQLESIVAQIEIFDTMDDSLTDYYLDYLLKSMIADTLNVQDLFDAYLSGDEEKIEELILVHSGSDPNIKIINDRLIKDRNINMAKKIKELHSNEKIHFIIAGAAHFVGDEGIISILNKDKKYKIIRK